MKIFSLALAVMANVSGPLIVITVFEQNVCFLFLQITVIWDRFKFNGNQQFSAHRKQIVWKLKYKLSRHEKWNFRGQLTQAGLLMEQQTTKCWILTKIYYSIKNNVNKNVATKLKVSYCYSYNFHLQMANIRPIVMNLHVVL